MKILVALSGGLGNQMFQYAAARSLAQRVGAELALDTWSGFVRDRQYRRTYELGAFPIQGRVARSAERLPIWLRRWKYRGARPPSQPFEHHWFGDFLVETADVPPAEAGENYAPSSFSHQRFFHQFVPRRSIWLIGYWQSPLYFNDITPSLQVELMPPAPAAANFRALGAELQLPTNTVFVTNDDGYSGTLDTLWLITRCQHHIFTNSSYYWWGAWLSAAVRGEEGQQIIAPSSSRTVLSVRRRLTR